MELEFLASEGGGTDSGAYDLGLLGNEDGHMVVDWEPMLRNLVSDIDKGVRPAIIAAKFHNTLVEMIADVVKQAGFERVALSGGCFQNRYLLEHAVERLTTEGFRVYRHQRVPTNDGGISLGQIAAAARELKKEGGTSHHVPGGSGKNRNN
jgi:hydrogenase maturation protein HypF